MSQRLVNGISKVFFNFTLCVCKIWLFFQIIKVHQLLHPVKENVCLTLLSDGTNALKLNLYKKLSIAFD